MDLRFEDQNWGGTRGFPGTLSDPMDCSLLDSSIHGIFQARVLEWGASAFSRNPKITRSIQTAQEA